MIDEVASAVNAAKGILMALDRSRLETSVPTEHLRWLLLMLVDLGSQAPQPHGGTRPESRVADSAFRTTLGHIVEIEQIDKEARPLLPGPSAQQADRSKGW